MAKIKDLLARRSELEATVGVYEEILSLAYSATDLRSRFGDSVVDTALTRIDEDLLAPARVELEAIDEMEVGSGKGKKGSRTPRKAAKSTKRVQGRKAPRAKAG